MMTEQRLTTSLGDLRERRALVLGLARSGVAVARFLADAGAQVTAYDRRPATELADAVAALGGRPVRLELGVAPDRGRELVAASDLLVTSPSISTRFPTTDAWLRAALAGAQERGIEAISEVELFLRLTRARILAVTGTKGKTTTTALLGAMLRAGGLRHEVGGNIGRPLIELAPRLGSDTWAVLELSELQLPTISRGADVAVYTNVMADHLDRHGSVAAYRAVKARLAELSAAHGGQIVLNRDDPGCRELGATLEGAALHWYARDGGAASVVDDWLALDGRPLMPLDEVQLPGEHLLHDVLAAALASALLGVAPDAIRAAIRDFPGVPHRLERLGERHGVRYFNDSQATIPAATIAALGAFEGSGLVLIAGGSDKGLDYGELADEIARRCRAVVLIGETAAALERLVDGRVPVERAVSMEEALAAASRRARPGDVVLLSPAAASFDMFADYAARGDAFRAAVERIGSGAA